MGTYTTAALVQKECKKIDSTLVEADLENYITMAEGVLKAIMKDDKPASFDASKHGLLQEFTTVFATLKAVTFDTTNFASTVDAELTINAFILRLKLAIELLNDPKTRQFLKGA